MQYTSGLGNKIIVMKKSELNIGAENVPLESRELLGYIPKSRRSIELADMVVIYQGCALSILKSKQPHPICDLSPQHFEIIKELIQLNERCCEPITDNLHKVLLNAHQTKLNNAE